MNSIIYRINRSNRKHQYIGALFFFLCAIYFGISAIPMIDINISEFFINILLMVFSLLIGTYGCLLAARSKLIISQEGIGVQKIFRIKFFGWQDFYSISITPTIFRLHYSYKGIGRDLEVIKFLHKQIFYIPLSNFIKDWYSAEAWQTDPLLVRLNSLFNLGTENQNHLPAETAKNDDRN